MYCLRSGLPGLSAVSSHVAVKPVTGIIAKTTVNLGDPITAKPKLPLYGAYKGAIPALSSSLFGTSSVRFTHSVVKASHSVVKAFTHNDIPKPNYSDADRVKNWDQQLNKDHRRAENQLPSYLMVGVGGGLCLYLVKYAAYGVVCYIGPPRDQLAMAAIEINLLSIPEGKNVVFKWRGKPLFIRHRTAEEIAAAVAIDISTLRDPETDESRFINPKFLVVIGVCTHLGCVPISHAGDFGGFYCPCHGSHYDTSGRIHKGPAPLNLEIPEYEYLDENTIIVGKVD